MANPTNLTQASNFFFPKNVVIPGIVLDDPTLKIEHIRLFGLISSLANKYGYCFASNRRLANTLRTTLRTLQKHLERLEKNGYIERREEGDEFNNERHIYILEQFQKSNTTPMSTADRGGC